MSVMPHTFKVLMPLTSKAHKPCIFKKHKLHTLNDIIMPLTLKTYMPHTLWLAYWLTQLHLTLTVPSLTNRPEALLTGRAVCAVLGVLMAFSIVPGWADWVPGLTKPLSGLPDWDIGLKCQNSTLVFSE